MFVILFPCACGQPQQIKARLSLIKASGRMDSSILCGSGNDAHVTTQMKETRNSITNNNYLLSITQLSSISIMCKFITYDCVCIHQQLRHNDRLKSK